MAGYEDKAPGVYVEERPVSGPIIGAGTSTAALIGAPATAPAAAALDQPKLVTSWTSYVQTYGIQKAGLALPYAVRGFFENGGSLAYIVPVKDPTKIDGALSQLTRIHDVNLVCAPGVTDPIVQNAIIKHCEDMGNRFAVLDGVQDTDPAKPDGLVQSQVGALDSDNGFGGLYWPWIVVDDPSVTAAGQAPVATVPPSGHVAGIMARSDGQFGVHKAPANEAVRGVRDIDFVLNDAEQGQLNKVHVNAIRRFTGRPPTLWGARTVSKDVPWRYVNVRRLVSFVEDSIRQNIGWAVFAPNNVALGKQLERTITEFLTRVWQSGGLFGRTAAEAFFVNVSDELNPAAVRAAGQVVVEIGLAPVRPAEFVVLQFGLWDGGAQGNAG